MIADRSPDPSSTPRREGGAPADRGESPARRPLVQIDRFVRKHTTAIDVETLHQRGLTKINYLTFSKINELVAIAVAKAVQKVRQAEPSAAAAGIADVEKIHAVARDEVQEQLAKIGAVPARSPSHAGQGGMSESAAKALGERLRQLFASVQAAAGSAGAAAGLAKLEARLIEIVGETYQADRGSGGYFERLERDTLRRIDLYERRIEKLREHNAQLELAVRELEARSAEPGVPSVYRQVQGLDAGDSRFEQKKEVLAVIFQDNLKLQQKDALDKQTTH